MSAALSRYDVLVEAAAVVRDAWAAWEAVDVDDAAAAADATAELVAALAGIGTALAAVRPGQRRRGRVGSQRSVAT